MRFLKRVKRSRQAWMIVILLSALALRLSWLDDEGCIPAVSFFIPWMRLAAQGGIARVFEAAESSYPPLTVYILQALGWFGAAGTLEAAPTLVESLALRVTTVFFDLVTIALLYRIGKTKQNKRANALEHPDNLQMRRQGIRPGLIPNTRCAESLLAGLRQLAAATNARVGRQLTRHWIGVAAALLYALCPTDIYLSGWWIQIEAWFVLPALLGAWWLSRGRVALAWAALGVAVALKPQAAIVFPVFLVGTWRWWGFGRMVMGGMVLLSVVVLVFVPILLSGQGRAILSKMVEPGYDFPWVSLRSYNAWFAVTERARDIGSDFYRDQNTLVGHLSFHDVGWSLMALAYGLVLARLFVRSGPREVFVACILAWLSFFLLPTRIHSRYLFPTQAFMLVAGFRRRRWWALYAVSAATLFVNVAVRACEISPSTCVLSLTLPTAVEIFLAWVNVAVGGLAFVFYLQPLWWPRDRQARLEGTLREAHGWERLLLAAGGLLLVGLVGGVLWRGWTVGAELARLKPSMRASLVDALEEDAGEAVVVNWPHVIAAGDGIHLGGVIPVVPPALFFAAPEDAYPRTTWAQYPPWQRSDELEIDYHGTYVTQAELREQVRRADQVVGYRPAVDEMVVLAQRRDAASPSDCVAQFGDLACLTDAQVTAREDVLRVNLTWQVWETLPPGTTVFVHVVDADGELIAQADGGPARGLIPLSDWGVEAEALAETRLVVVPSAEVNRVWVGLYNRGTGDRLTVECHEAQTCLADAVQIAGP